MAFHLEVGVLPQMVRTSHFLGRLESGPGAESAVITVAKDVSFSSPVFILLRVFCMLCFSYVCLMCL